MKLFCPECRTEIPLQDVNVATDLALCRRCERNFSYANLLPSKEDALDVTRQPKRTWFERTISGFELGASTRGWEAFFLVPFMCVWSGVALTGIYGLQIQQHKFNLFLSLFGIPFLLATFFMGSEALMLMAGKVVVRVEKNRGAVFTGIGPFGRTKRFDWSLVSHIERTVAGRGKVGTPFYRITLQGERPIHFGKQLKGGRQQWILDALRQLLRERNRVQS